ncbi:hypothetical protein KZI27_10685 [Curtobacterium sp. TC1]|uniref:hypothetical protein n=1 Tax=Curtobacterium sp. TC1 TaxID=2862880 RepID=UPI001C9B0C9B|nr:hypothetical protein [Curtobacterium sp. TC1]QZQ53834.1 hypothetical protein KZI27_10685 [Curtobacterium sp. TC1]
MRFVVCSTRSDFVPNFAFPLSEYACPSKYPFTPQSRVLTIVSKLLHVIRFVVVGPDPVFPVIAAAAAASAGRSVLAEHVAALMVVSAVGSGCVDVAT